MGKTFTFVGKEVAHITKLFRKQNLESAFKTNSNVGKVLNMNKVTLQRTKYEISGVYQFHVQIVILFTPDKQADSLKYDIMSTFWFLIIILIIIIIISFIYTYIIII